MENVAQELLNLFLPKEIDCIYPWTQTSKTVLSFLK
jgi:hypothetical protein